MKIGYVRISTTTQNTARQDVLMEQLGVEKVYTDKVSGKNADRPQLRAMMDSLQPGDSVIVESISRFARNTKDLLILADQLTEKGVDFISKKEGFDTNTPAGRLMLTMFGAIAELERAYILDRSREGIAIAKVEGKYSGANHKGRVRAQVDAELFESVYISYSEKSVNLEDAARQVGLSVSQTRRRFKEREKLGDCYDPNEIPV